MATECIPQLTFAFQEKLRPVVARFDQAHASTDGGSVLLTALDAHLRLTDQLAACLPDGRDPDKIRHTMRDLLRQRIFGPACGYEDGNDAARLADDPLHKLAVGRDPVTGEALASQPTLSRFENALGPRPCIGWDGPWRRRSLRTIGAGSRGALSASRLIWTRRTIRRTDNRNWPSSMGTTIFTLFSGRQR